MVIQNYFGTNRDKIDWQSVGWKWGKLKEDVGGLKSTYMEKLIRELLSSVYQNRRARATEGR